MYDARRPFRRQKLTPKKQTACEPSHVITIQNEGFGFVPRLALYNIIKGGRPTRKNNNSEESPAPTRIGLTLYGPHWLNGTPTPNDLTSSISSHLASPHLFSSLPYSSLVLSSRLFSSLLLSYRLICSSIFRSSALRSAPMFSSRFFYSLLFASFPFSYLLLSVATVGGSMIVI